MYFLPLGFSPPANCGQAYAHLVQSADGYGPTNPTGWKPWASEADVKNWQVPAEHIHGLVRAKWNALVRTENQRGDWSQSRAIGDYITNYENAYDALPEPKAWQVMGQDKAVGEYVRNCQLGACALELLDRALAATPGTPTMPTPYQDQGGFGFGENFGLLLLIGLAAWAFFDTRSASK